MKIEIVDLRKRFQEEKLEILESINRVLKKGNLILTPEVQNFEKSICKFTGAKFCLGVNSGTDALMMSLWSVAIPSVATVSISFAIGISLYVALNLFIGLDGKSAQALALGTILVLGVSYLLAQGLAGGAPRKLMVLTALYAVLASFAYIVFHKLAETVTEGLLPAVMSPGPLEWGLLFLTLTSFAITAFAQSTFPMWAHHPAVRGVRIHLINGLYINAILDRVLGSRRPSTN